MNSHLTADLRKCCWLITFSVWVIWNVTHCVTSLWLISLVWGSEHNSCPFRTAIMSREYTAVIATVFYEIVFIIIIAGVVIVYCWHYDWKIGFKLLVVVLQDFINPAFQKKKPKRPNQNPNLKCITSWFLFSHTAKPPGQPSGILEYRHGFVWNVFSAYS